MTDQYEPFGDDFDRQFIDSTHPLYVSPASTASVGLSSIHNDDFDPVTQTVIQRNVGTELGPVGKALTYSFCGLILAYRSEERRAGQEGVRTCRSRWSPKH